MDELKAMGTKIAQLRTQQKLSQEDLAEKSGVDRSYLSEIENGHKNPSAMTIIKIIRALGVSPNDIFKL